MSSHLQKLTLSARAARETLASWFSAEETARYSIFRPSAAAGVLLIQNVRDAEQARSWAEGPEMQTWQKYGSEFATDLSQSEVTQALGEELEEGCSYSVAAEPDASFHIEPQQELRFVDGLAVHHFFFNSLYPDRVTMGQDGSVFANLFLHFRRSEHKEQMQRTIDYGIVQDDGHSITQNQLCELVFAAGKTDTYISTKVAFKLRDTGSFRLEVVVPGMEATPLCSHRFAALREERRGDPDTLKELAAQRAGNVGEFE